MTTRTIECDFHFERRHHGSRELHEGCAPKQVALQGHVPRITRLLALAIRFDKLLRDGVVRNQAELARLGHVSRARVSQLSNLTLLAPDIQEEILFLPRVAHGRAPVLLRHLQPIALEPNWRNQRRLWRILVKRRASS